MTVYRNNSKTVRDEVNAKHPDMVQDMRFILSVLDLIGETEIARQILSHELSKLLDDEEPKADVSVDFITAEKRKIGEQGGLPLYRVKRTTKDKASAALNLIQQLLAKEEGGASTASTLSHIRDVVNASGYSTSYEWRAVTPEQWVRLRERLIVRIERFVDDGIGTFMGLSRDQVSVHDLLSPKTAKTLAATKDAYVGQLTLAKNEALKTLRAYKPRKAPSRAL